MKEFLTVIRKLRVTITDQWNFRNVYNSNDHIKFLNVFRYIKNDIKSLIKHKYIISYTFRNSEGFIYTLKYNKKNNFNYHLLITF